MRADGQTDLLLRVVDVPRKNRTSGMFCVIYHPRCRVVIALCLRLNLCHATKHRLRAAGNSSLIPRSRVLLQGAGVAQSVL
jgi:hypothetical protein